MQSKLFNLLFAKRKDKGSLDLTYDEERSVNLYKENNTIIPFYDSNNFIEFAETKNARDHSF